jgi:hypothetical protein
VDAGQAMTTVPPDSISPQGLAERVLWHSIVWTYGYYVLGALYVLAPVIGWTLLVRLAKQRGLAEVPAVVWAWAVGMLVMLLALIVAHADFDLGLGLMIKSSIGWAKGWALIVVFMIIGCGQVRLALLARAAALLGIQTLCVLPVVILAWAAGLPQQLYISPVSLVGGPGPEYFAVELYGISPDNGAPRWRLFAPWAPAIGMVMAVYFFLVLNERNARLRRWGLAGIVLSIVLSGSRLGLLALPITWGLTWLFSNRSKPSLYFTAAPLALLAGLSAQTLSDLYEQAVSGFHGARADSSRVRATLGRIALERWRNEAVLWGHGAVERGPHLVEYMPIGSHHTWFGLLFVKGLVGALALAIPMLWSAAVLIRHAGRSELQRTALSMLILIMLYTFAENLEILAYLYWPALVVLGLAFREAAREDVPAETVDPANPAVVAQPHANSL